MEKSSDGITKMNEVKKERNHYGYIAVLSAILFISLWGVNIIASLFFLACLIYESNKYRKMNKKLKTILKS